MPKYQLAKPFDIVKVIRDLQNSVQQLQIRSNGTTYPTPWNTVSLAAGWSLLSGQPVPSYRFIAFHVVEIVGAIQYSTSFSGSTTVTASAINSSFIPKTQIFIAGGPGAAGLAINTDGSLVAAPSGSTMYCNFNGTYPTDL